MTPRPIVTDAEMVLELEDLLLKTLEDNYGGKGLSVEAVSATVGLLGALAGALFKYGAEQAWSSVFENESLRALFADRFEAMRQSMKEETPDKSH